MSCWERQRLEKQETKRPGYKWSSMSPVKGYGRICYGEDSLLLFSSKIVEKENSH